jgi:hypothetical protein
MEGFFGYRMIDFPHFKKTASYMATQILDDK